MRIFIIALIVTSFIPLSAFAQESEPLERAVDDDCISQASRTVGESCVSDCRCFTEGCEPEEMCVEGLICGGDSTCVEPSPSPCTTHDECGFGVCYQGACLHEESLRGAQTPAFEYPMPCDSDDACGDYGACVGLVFESELGSADIYETLGIDRGAGSLFGDSGNADEGYDYGDPDPVVIEGRCEFTFDEGDRCTRTLRDCADGLFCDLTEGRCLAD